MTSSLRAVLWDLDGTLIDTHPLIVQCFCETLAAQARVFDAEAECHGLLGRPLGEMFETMLAVRGMSVPTSLLIEDYRVRMKALDGGLVPFPGIQETLQALQRQGVPLAVVTTKHAVLALRHLEQTGLLPYFSTVVCGDHCERYKPHPEPFHLALRRLDLPTADRSGVVMVGDSAPDLLGATAAGIIPVGAGWGVEDLSTLSRAGARHVLRSPMDLMDLVIDVEHG